MAENRKCRRKRMLGQEGQEAQGAQSCSFEILYFSPNVRVEDHITNFKTVSCRLYLCFLARRALGSK
jgi:hypothetical protein